MDTVIIGAENSHSPGDLFERFPGKYHGAVLSVDHGSGKPRKKALKSQLLPANDTDCWLLPPLESPPVKSILLAYLGMAKGLMMTRLFAAAAISICSLFLISVPAKAQTDSDCFPWQEMRDGRCAPKGTSAPTRAPSMSAPCIGGTNDAGGQCLCPANTHLDDASGSCLVNAAPAVPQAPQPAVVCAPLHVHRARFFFSRLCRAHGIETEFRIAHVQTGMRAFAWEIAAAAVCRRQLRADRCRELPRR